MDAKTAQARIKLDGFNVSLEIAQWFLDICAERGLTPFQEAYYGQIGGKPFIKEHYTVQSRWAQQSGGYATLERKSWTDESGNLNAIVRIVSNQAYAGVGKLAAACSWSRDDFRDELSIHSKKGTATVKAREMKRQPPNGHDWEWVAYKRATEDAEKRLFGKEPSQSRELYAAIAANDPERKALASEAARAMYGALPAPVDSKSEVLEGELVDNEPPQVEVEAPSDPDAIIVKGQEWHVEDMSDVQLDWVAGKHKDARARELAAAERERRELEAIDEVDKITDALSDEMSNYDDEIEL